MDTFITFAKENYQLITFFVGLIGVIVAFIAMIYELKAKKRKKKDESHKDDI